MLWIYVNIFLVHSNTHEIMQWSILLLVTVAVTRAQQTETCLSGNQDPYLLFGSKTSYSNANRHNTKNRDVLGCEPLAIWLLNRHGSHNPELDEMDGLRSLSNVRDNFINNYKNSIHKQFHEHICSADLELLEQWRWNRLHQNKFAGNLTSAGYIETQLRAQAWQKKYPGLFTRNPNDYTFGVASRDRDATSFRAFVEGLFVEQAEKIKYTHDPKNDHILEPQKCKQWVTNVLNNSETLNQQNLFINSAEYKEMITQISHRLAFTWTISESIISNMYQLCAYMKAWKEDQISPFCAVFTNEELRRMEYVEDLETYYKYGYGTEFNRKIGCLALRDIMDLFTKHVDLGQPQQPRAKVFFTDAPAILMTLTALGMFQNEPLTSRNYHLGPVQQRKWSTSNLVPYNGNFAAVLYKCEESNVYKEKYQVLFLSNEKPIDFSQQCKSGLCGWSFVKENFGAIASQCREQDCNAATSLKAILMLSLVLTGLLRLL